MPMNNSNGISNQNQSKFKRRITVEQLNELSEEQKLKLRELWDMNLGDYYYYPTINHSDVISTSLLIDFERIKTVCYPLLDIGQMIKLLDERDDYLEIIRRRGRKIQEYYGFERDYTVKFRDINYCKNTTGELCDALWEAVKEVL